MRRSKLETSLDILCVLALNGQLKLTHLILKSKVNCQPLKRHLAFLIDYGLIEKKATKSKELVYTISSQGIAILRAFKSINQNFPLTEEISLNQYSQTYFLSSAER